jgi:uncharacterized protein YpbB
MSILKTEGQLKLLNTPLQEKHYLSVSQKTEVAETHKQCKSSRPQTWRLADKPAGAVEILFVTLIAAPQPSALFSQLQGWTAITTTKKQIKLILTLIRQRVKLPH